MEWREWVLRLANSKNPRDKELLVAKIEILLQEQKKEIKESIKSLPLMGMETEDWARSQTMKMKSEARNDFRRELLKQIG